MQIPLNNHCVPSKSWLTFLIFECTGAHEENSEGQPKSWLTFLIFECKVSEKIWYSLFIIG